MDVFKFIEFAFYSAVFFYIWKLGSMVYRDQIKWRWIKNPENPTSNQDGLERFYQLAGSEPPDHLKERAKILDSNWRKPPVDNGKEYKTTEVQNEERVLVFNVQVRKAKS